jgi:O-antigen/teichoic acid export membrane protein
VFPVVLVIVVFAPEGLRVWLGPSFAENGGPVIRWLAAGVFVNSLTHVPFALIQSAGRPDLTAKMHLLELPLYLAALWLLTMRLGIQGAAIAWTGRITFDACLIWLFAQRRLPRGSTFLVRVAAKTGVGLLLLYAGTLATGVYVRAGFLVSTLLLFMAFSWIQLLAPEERALLLRRRTAIAAVTSVVEEPRT